VSGSGFQFSTFSYQLSVHIKALLKIISLGDGIWRSYLTPET